MNAFYANKLAIITGGSEGIGLSLAQDLVALGANVIICARNAQKLSQAVTAIEAKKKNASQKVVSASLDVTDYANVQSQVNEWVSAHGVPDFFINCAGIAQPGYLTDLDIEAYRQMMDLNYFGLVHTAKAIVPHMMRAKKGHIVNTSSMAGFIGLFGYTGYCGSKYAAIGFSKALEAEVKPYGIRVSVLCPPNTRTPGLDRENLTKPAEVLKVEEKAKVVDPGEVSQALLKAMPKNQFMIVPTFDGRMAHVLSRLFPSILDQFVKRPS